MANGVIPAALGRLTRWMVIAAAFALGAARVPAESAAPAGHTIVFFGDSITAGYGLDDPATESYPGRIAAKLKAGHPDWRAVNAGLSGETSAGGLRRVDWILRQPVDIFFLALGGNDGLRGIDPAVTRHNLEDIVARVRARQPRAKIVIAGMQMPPGMGEEYVQKFRAIFPQVAADTHATLLPFLLEGVGGRPDLNQSDSIHPNATGHRLIAENVWKTLEPLL